MKCLETRETEEGYKRRRYETAAGHRFTTIEVPMEIWKRVNSVGRQRDRAAEAARALQRQAVGRQAAGMRTATGLSYREIARRLGISASTVRRYARRTES